VPIKLYMDHHVPRAITEGLRIRRVDVLTAAEDHAYRLPDDKLLDRAGELNRVLFTRDEDLLREATGRQRNGQTFIGVIYAHQLRVSIGGCIRDLELISKACEPQDFVNRVEYLPL